MKQALAARPLRFTPGHTLSAGAMRAFRGLVTCLFVTVGASQAAAQDSAIVIYPDSAPPPLEERELPRLVAEELVRFYNAATTTRLLGRSHLPAGNEWRGDVAVRGGPVTVAGRVTGSLVVVNGDLALEDGAEITGDVTVAGGTISGGPAATVHGVVQEYREALPYRLRGDELVYAPTLRSRFPRVGAGRTWQDERSRSTLMLATGGTFNRIEGLPVVIGPEFDWRLGDDLRLKLEALGVFRSAGDLSDDRGDLGYLLRAQLHAGKRRTAGIEFGLYDVVSPIENWGLSGAEVGWATFLFHRDYRDYYLTKGLAGQAFLQVERPLRLALEVRSESHSSAGARDPWTVFRTNQPWRPNVPIDDGKYLAVAVELTIDTRNDDVSPSSGWLFRARMEHAGSRDVSPQTGLASVRASVPTDGSYAFERAFFDLRRYTRVSASGRLHLRLVAGGWVGGDPLPAQHRLSLGGPDPMAGYAFRHSACNRDVIAQSFTGAEVAACDRILVLQAEYRGHVALSWTYPARENGRRGSRGQLIRLEGPDIVVFANTGQAWLVGRGPGRIPSDRIPTLGTWLADFGLGIDWSGLGVYVAKAVTVGQPLRFTLRLDHRF